MNEDNVSPEATELPLKYPYLGGWKTWAGALGLGLLAVVDLIEGDIEAALTKLSAALGLIGIGHKIQKARFSGGLHG